MNGACGCNDCPSACLISEITVLLLYVTIGLAVESLQKQVKGKAVLLQVWTGPEGFMKLRFPDFVTTAQDGGKVVSLTHRQKQVHLQNTCLLQTKIK